MLQAALDMETVFLPCELFWKMEDSLPISYCQEKKKPQTTKTNFLTKQLKLWDRARDGSLTVHTASFFACSTAVFQPVPTSTLQEEAWVWFGDRSRQELLQIRVINKNFNRLDSLWCTPTQSHSFCAVPYSILTPLRAIHQGMQHKSFTLLPSKHSPATLNMSLKINISTT